MGWLRCCGCGGLRGAEFVGVWLGCRCGRCLRGAEFVGAVAVGVCKVWGG